jgi:hypothetical protein
MKKNRIRKALERLEKQLVSKTKTEKKTGKKVSLTEHDVKRIEKEIEILKK